MKKAFAFVLFTFMLFAPAKSQNAYYDAKKIDSLRSVNNIGAAFAAYLPYFADNSRQVNYNSLFSLMDSSFRASVYTYRLANGDSLPELCKNYLADYCRPEKPFDSLCLKCSLLLNAIKNQALLKSKMVSDSLRYLADKNVIEAFPDSVSIIPNDTPVLVYNIAKANGLQALKARLDSLNAITADTISFYSSIDTAVRTWFTTPASIANNKKAFNSFMGVGKLSGNTIAIPPKSAINETSIIAQQESIRNDIISRNETTTLTNFKIPSQSEMIDALAIYIGRRFKQEVAITLMSGLRKALNRQQLLVELFPETVKLFNDGEEFEMPKFGKIWSHSISEDFIGLPQNICNSSFIKQKTERLGTKNMFAVYQDIVKISSLVLEKNSLPEIVALASADDSLLQSADVKQYFNMLNLINSELFDTSSTERYWISWKQLQSMDSSQFAIFLSLAEGKYPAVFTSVKPSLWKPEITRAFKNYLVKALVVLNGLQKSQKEYLNRLEKQPDAIYTGTNFWDYQKNIFIALHDTRFLNLTDKDSGNVQLLEKVSGIYKLLETRQYAAMVHESVGVLEQLMPKLPNRYNELLVKTWKTEKNRYAAVMPVFNEEIEQLQEMMAATLSAKDTIRRQKLFSATMRQYGRMLDKNIYQPLLVLSSSERFKSFFESEISAAAVSTAAEQPVKSRFLYVTKSAQFFTDLMSAGNSKELASVIEAYSMPANSYKIKRNSRFSVDLNAYVGAFAGAESIKVNNAAGAVSYSVKPVYGISVPLGITLSWGTKRNATRGSAASFLTKKGNLKELKRNCYSLSITIIDIAAAVTYRLENGENVALPKEIKWSQVLSPGIHYRLGIPNTPLTWSAGLQFTPQLRNLDKPVNMQQAVRVYSGIFFDLPMFNVYKR